jgi:hypothetical protein
MGNTGPSSRLAYSVQLLVYQIKISAQTRSILTGFLLFSGPCSRMWGWLVVPKIR